MSSSRDGVSTKRQQQTATCTFLCSTNTSPIINEQQLIIQYSKAIDLPNPQPCGARSHSSICKCTPSRGPPTPLHLPELPLTINQSLRLHRFIPRLPIHDPALSLHRLQWQDDNRHRRKRRPRSRSRTTLRTSRSLESDYRLSKCGERRSCKERY